MIAPHVMAGPSREFIGLGGLEMLTQVECQRASRLIRHRDRQDFLTAHLLVRHCAARVLGVAANSLTLVQHCDHCGPGHGRPHLAEAPALGISLSHSQGYVCVATGSGRVGVDAQRTPDGPFKTGLAQRCLAPAERAFVADNGALVRQWVRKEALIKRGELTLDRMSSLDLSVLPLDHPTTARHLQWKTRHLLEWLSPCGVAVTVITDTPATAVGVALA